MTSPEQHNLQAVKPEITQNNDVTYGITDEGFKRYIEEVEEYITTFEGQIVENDVILTILPLA